jgi:hypothetical protein
MPIPAKPDEVKITLRLPADLHRALLERSGSSLRSLNAEILFRLRETLKLRQSDQ